MASVARDVDLLPVALSFHAVRHVDACAVHVELPAVVDAAQAVKLVPPEEQRRPPMRAVRVDAPDPPMRVAEHDELLTHQHEAHRLAVGLRQLAGKQGGEPEPAEQFAHRLPGPNLRDHGIVFYGQHIALHFRWHRGRAAPAWHWLVANVAHGRGLSSRGNAKSSDCVERND